MRLLFAGIALLCLIPFAAAGSPRVAHEEAERLGIEALAGRSSERMHGRSDFILEDPDLAVDRTTGHGKSSPDDDCANVPVMTKRSDGRTVARRIDVCD